MDIEQLWQKALKETQIHHHRLSSLSTFSNTEVDYLVLSASHFNDKDTVVRSGRINIMHPVLILPPDYPQLEGFALEELVDLNADSLRSFLYMRGVRLPSLKYYNKTYTMEVLEEPLSDTLSKYKNELERKEDVHTGLIVGPNDAWQFSLLLYVATLIDKSIDKDIKNILDRYKKEGQ